MNRFIEEIKIDPVDLKITLEYLSCEDFEFLVNAVAPLLKPSTKKQFMEECRMVYSKILACRYANYQQDIMQKTRFALKMVPAGILSNIDHPTSLTDSIATRYVVAVLGAWCAEGATYPFDLTKTRLQIQSEFASAKHGYTLEHHGMIKTAIDIVKKEGLMKLWSGLMPMLHRHIIYAGCRLVTYEHYRNYFKDSSGKLSLGMAIPGGMFSGALGQWLANPADVVKTQMQSEGRRVLQGKPSRFVSCMACYKMLYKESGIRGFWRGAVPNAHRAAFVTLGDLASYDMTKQFLIRRFNMADNIILHTISAFAAGFVAAVLATPADMIKTRLMNQPVGPDGRGLSYRGMIDCLQQSVKHEGLFSLYKGFVPLWIRLGPWAVVNWIAFENIMLAIGGKTF